MNNIISILISNLIIVVLACTGYYGLLDLVQISLFESIAICGFSYFKFFVSDNRSRWHWRNSDASEGVFWEVSLLIIYAVTVYLFTNALGTFAEIFLSKDLRQISTASTILMIINMIVIWIVLYIPYLKHTKFDDKELQRTKEDICIAFDKLLAYVLLVVTIALSWKLAFLALNKALLIFMLGKIITDYLLAKRKLNLIFYRYRDHLSF